MDFNPAIVIAKRSVSSRFIPGRLSSRDWCCTWVTCETSLHLLHASSRSPIPGILARSRAVQIAAWIRASSRVEHLPTPFSLSLSLSLSLTVSLTSAMLSIPLPFPGSVCTASINIYNETPSSDCTPLPIWPESLANAPVILGRLPVIFTKRGH